MVISKGLKSLFNIDLIGEIEEGRIICHKNFIVKGVIYHNKI